MIVSLDQPAIDIEIKKASQEYKHYIKITIDIEKEIIAIGGEYHYDAEQELLKRGCNQKSIWEELNSTPLPTNKKILNLFADKILTISRIIFNRTIYYALN